jgi:GntR family transcriptional repressor for pyruvate dehydrogenase complex
MVEYTKPITTITYESIVTDSIATQIAEKIRQSILDGRLKVDDRLPTEEELARQFEVSRPTVREALKRLAAQHLIRSRRGPSGGTFIKRPSLGDLNANLALTSTLLVSMGEFDMDAILEARQNLEITCARLAAARRSAEHLKALETEIEYQQQEQISDVEFCASDVRFHRLITEAAGNSVLKFLMHAVIEALQPVENMIIFRFRKRKVIVIQHRDILQAIRIGDADSVGAAIKKQMEYIRSQFTAATDWRKSKSAPRASGPINTPGRSRIAKRILKKRTRIARR